MKEQKKDFNKIVEGKDTILSIFDCAAMIQERTNLSNLAITVDSMLEINPETVNLMRENFIANEVRIQVVKRDVFIAASKKIIKIIKKHNLISVARRLQESAKNIIKSSVNQEFIILNGITTFSTIKEAYETCLSFKDEEGNINVNKLKKELTQRFNLKTKYESNLYTENYIKMYDYAKSGIHTTEYGSNFFLLNSVNQGFCSIVLFAKIVEENHVTWLHSENSETNPTNYMQALWSTLTGVVIDKYKKEGVEFSIEDIHKDTSAFLSNEKVCEKAFEISMKGMKKPSMVNFNKYMKYATAKSSSDIFPATISHKGNNSLSEVANLLQELYKEKGNNEHYLTTIKKIVNIFQGHYSCRELKDINLIKSLEQYYKDDVNTKVEARFCYSLLQEKRLLSSFLDNEIKLVNSLKDAQTLEESTESFKMFLMEMDEVVKENIKETKSNFDIKSLSDDEKLELMHVLYYSLTEGNKRELAKSEFYLDKANKDIKENLLKKEMVGA